MESMLRVGAITSPYGIKGEAKVSPTTDDAKHFRELKKVILDTGKEHIPMEIEHMKFFKNVAILKFKGYDNISEIEKYRSRDLPITRDQTVDLVLDECFITDLIGFAAVPDQGVELGTLKDVPEIGTNDAYVATMKDGEELMLPVIDNCILNVGLEQRHMGVHVLEGLMDL